MSKIGFDVHFLQEKKYNLLFNDWQIATIFLLGMLFSIMVIYIFFRLNPPTTVVSKKEVSGDVVGTTPIICKGKISCSNGYSEDMEVKLFDGGIIHLVNFNPEVVKGNHVLVIEEHLANGGVIYYNANRVLSN
jgi:hypothetical protein